MHVVGAGLAVAMLQVSALPLQVRPAVVDGGRSARLPNFTYMSASPVPPAMTNFRLVAPAGTTIV